MLFLSYQDKMFNFTEINTNSTSAIDYSDSISDDGEDINERYNLHIIVPVLWSLIIVFGILGKLKLFVSNILIILL